MATAHSRRYPRIIAHVPVDYTIGNQSSRCIASSLSGGGLFLTQVGGLETDDQIWVRFRPAKHLPVIQAQAIVCYKVGNGAAVVFTEITSQDRHHILRFIHGKTGNRRNLARAPLATQIQCEQRLSLALSRDISLAGMFVETKHPLPVGSPLLVRVNLDEKDKVVITAACVAYHVEKMGMGILFSELPPQHRAAIEEYVESHPDLSATTSPRGCLDPCLLPGQQNVACGLGSPA